MQLTFRMAFMNLPVYSKTFLEVENEDWSATPTSSLLHRIHHSHDETTVRWIAVLTYKGNDFHIALGDPIRDSSQVLFVPGWFLHQMGVIGDGEEMEISFVPAETFPKASRLQFSLIGDRETIPDGVDIRDLLETPLSQLGVLSHGQTIPIPVLEHHFLLVKECDPSEIVFLDGSEIAFEMESESPPVTKTPASTPVFSSQPNFFDGPIISSMSTPFIANTRSFQGKGRTLSEK